MNHCGEDASSHTTHVLGALCAGCSYCRLTCPFGAVSVVEGTADITDHCTDCGRCLKMCPVGAITRGERIRR